MKNERTESDRGGVVGREGWMDGGTAEGWVLVQCVDPSSTFPRASQRTQDVSKERNEIKEKALNFRS